MLIAEIHSSQKTVSRVCDEIIAGKYNVYLFGRNIWAGDIIDKLGIAGVIDEFTHEKAFKNVPVINNLNAINPATDIVISCILGRPWTIKQKLDARGIRNIDYFSFWRYCKLDLIDTRGWNVFKSNFAESKYEKLSADLNDAESKSTLENIVNFRLSQDMSFMKFYPDRQFYQYFEPFLNLSNETFVDVGGFDGLTSFQFVNYCNDPVKIIFFEPDGDNMAVAKSRLALVGCAVDFFQMGLSEKPQQLRFSNSGSTSTITENGDIIIDTNSIDNVLQSYSNDDKFYIKMDIEGWELSALEGAKETIKNKRPKLAICVYHKPNDLLDIYNYVKAINPSYKVYLRHYTEGIDETVMYFIPASIV